eukprot:1551473-Prymnesium_polylepis.1
MEELDDAKKKMEAATRTTTALEAQRELDHTDHLRSIRDAATAEQVKASHATQELEAQFGALQAEMQAQFQQLQQASNTRLTALSDELVRARSDLNAQ